ncbi:TraB/GumN family protein [Kordia sp. YSTF-M3]|uniref:TraB/GumN family protein n=1 Tax=Kordia aestuariivivens TaxID=2759037 RepID=A0ABR7QA15_9FLAO|nr:TraB/GumN family protein [Kordia aestuariivivens]MBC8755211.1 TraB/GumN family protein [Kordia aestuariivivens]
MKFYLSFLFLFCTSILLSQENKQSLLWEISGNGMEKPSFLYGTMHVSKKVAFRLDDVFFKALAEAETVALESDPTTWLAHNYESMSSSSTRASGNGKNFYDKSFNTQFSKKEIVRRIIRFDNRIINGYLYRKQAGADDFEEETYLDMFIYQAGKKNNKQIISLEDIEESQYLTSRAAFNMLKKKPDEWVQKMFKNENRYTLQEDVYRDRKIDLLDSIGAAVNTEFYREHMLFKRNENMVIVMDSLMQHKTVFAGVGAAHLAGEKGMLQMLEERGYTVKPLTSEQTDFALKSKTTLEDLHVKPYLNTYSTPDGFITIKTFDELREFVYKDQKFYLAPDMTNGAYLTITRLNTYDQFPNEEKITLEEIDPLLYEDIPGDIISKTALTSPFPGFSIVNKTKKGDYQKYHIYKTPLEMIIIKFGGKKDFVLQYEKEIFDSITFRSTSEDMKTYTSEYNKYEFLFPANFISDNTKNVGNKLLQAEVNDQYYFFKEVFNNDISYIEEDAFEAEYIHDNFYKNLDIEKIDGKFADYKYTSYESSAIIDSSTKKRIYLKTIIKDESYYLLGYIGDHEAKATTYFNSFKLKTPKYKKFKTVVDTSLHFSVLTNTKQPFTRSYSSYRRYKADKKAYNQEKKYIVYTSKSNEKIYVRRLKYHDLQMFHNVDSLWSAMEKDYTFNFVIEDKKYTQKDDTFISTYVLKDTASTKRIYTKNILKKGVLFGLSTLEDSIASPSKFVQNFYETFTPLDTLLGKDVFVDKTDIFFDGIKNNDSIVLKSYAKIKFADKHANTIISILKEHDFPDDRKNIKNYLITSLGKLKNNRIHPFFEELYVAAYDKPKTQTTILKSLLQQKDKASYALVLSLLEKDFPLDSRNTSRLFRTGINNLSLKKDLFPELLKYSSIQEYKTPIYSLLTQLSDSSLIKPKIYKKYKGQLLNDAKIEIKRNLGKSSSYNYSSSRALDNYVKLLFPFRNDKKVQDFFHKLIKTEARNALTTYITLLAEHNEPISPALKEKTIYNEESLAATLEKLAAKDLLSIIPDPLKTQQRYAKAKLLSRVSFDEEEDTISFLKAEDVTNEDGTITIYFFKIKEENRYRSSAKLYYITFLKTPTLNTKTYLVTKNFSSERIYGEEIDDELFEDAIELVKYKKRKRISGRR